MLEFVEHDDGVIAIVSETGEKMGNFIKVRGIYSLSLNNLVNSHGYLRQMADKLQELN
ncbi:MAG: hypothetical protein WC107_04585 [Patescibacteria group bacterium]